jgi:hypothetical protein
MEDPAHTFASEMALDLFNFCVGQLEIGISDGCWPGFKDNVDKDHFQVSSVLDTD